MGEAASQQEGAIQGLFRLLDGKRNEVRSILPSSISVDHFVGVCKTAVLNNPDLAHADRRTFFTACMAAATDGLFPDGKEAVLNVYKTKEKRNGREEWIQRVQYLPMAAGMIKKLYASGEVTFVDAAAVYENDHFDYERGDNQRLVHKPTMVDEPGPIIAAYAVIKLKNGEVKREVMPKRDIEKVRAASKSPNGPGWTKWPDQFAIKSVLKRAYKQLPKMKSFEDLAERDNEALGFVGFDALDSAPEQHAGVKALPQLSADEFEVELRNCVHAINAGRDAEEVLAMVETRHTLDEQQKALIRECGKPVEGELQPGAAPTQGDSWTSAYDRKEQEIENS